MKKRIISVILSIMMLISMIPLSAVLAASSTNLVVTADKTTAYPDDIVNYTISIGAVEHLMGAEFKVSIPAGMTYVTNSASVAEGLKTTLGCASADWTESSMKFTMYGDGDYSSNSNTKVLTFSCKIDTNATGSFSPKITDVVLSDTGYEEITTEVINAAGVVTITQRPVSVTGVTLNKDTLSLTEGDDETLIATITPSNATNKEVLWRSTDTSVATVDDGGKVKALKKGTTTVVVTTKDGGYEDSCIVSVACAHVDKNPTVTKTPNCQEGGWDAYYTCEGCGQLFAADGTTKIDAVPTIDKDENNHANVQPVAADPATCVHQGHDGYKKCMDCGVVTEGSDNKYFGGHNYGTLISAVSEKHTTDELSPSVAAHYKCSVCQKYFTEAKVETTLAVLTGETPAHNYGNWVTTDAEQHWKECGCGHKIEINNHNYDNNCDATCNTCGHVRTITHNYSNTWSTDGANHWQECTVCHVAKTDEGTHAGGVATCQVKKECNVCHLTYGDYASCDYVENPDAQYLKSVATCIAETVYKKSCSVCGTSHATETFEHGTVNANNHVGDTEIKDAKSTSCGEPGYTGDTWCKDCNTKIKDGEVIPAGHKITEVPAKGATHETAGNIKYYTCSGCDLLFADAEAMNIIKAEDTVVAKGEHSYGNGYETDAENHWKECACGNKIETTEHTFGDWIVTKESTTTEKGSKEKTCSVCGHRVTEELSLAEKTSADINSPKTGDNSHLYVWIMLIMVFACGIVMNAVINKKRVDLQ